MSEEGELMRKLIIDWGLPECLTGNSNDVIFKFDDAGLMGTKEKGYRCKDGDVKFCLCDKGDGKALFSMEFYKVPAVALQNCGFKLRLEFLYVHDESLRKKGVASYYFKKMIEYAVHEKVKAIVVAPNANADNFKKDKRINTLLQSELEEFYKKRSTPIMPVELRINKPT